MKRRAFIFGSLAALVAANQSKLYTKSIKFELEDDSSSKIFERIVARANKFKWAKQAIGDLMINIGKELLNTPYVGGTLEGEGPEVCRIDLTGLDCVTFFENVLCMARIIKKGSHGYDSLIEELTYTRYRNGIIRAYTSRLHYTSEWISNNIEKQVINDISEYLNGEKISFKLSFMSQNPHLYPALKDDSVAVAEIGLIEKALNSRSFYYIPSERVAKIEKDIKTGDIIGIVMNKNGLDYSHTGLAYTDKSLHKKGITKLMHASSKMKKVILDDRISNYLKNSKSAVGISVLRPLEPFL